MLIFPAIDIKNGRCVRLKQGNFLEQTIYGEDPCKIAKGFQSKGASHLHIVDLDGALVGKSINRNIIEQIVRETDLKVQVGGGIRRLKDIEDRLNLGVQRVILGTAAIKNVNLVKEAIKHFGTSRISVGIDGLDGHVAIEGWKKVSPITVKDLCFEMENIGVDTIIYTDINRDGMLIGPNFESTKELLMHTRMNVIASGGITSLADLQKLEGIGAYGAIVGKALYTGNIELKEALGFL